ncbi:MAG: hypothetical protein WAM79_04045 [Candidatus Sulfotelmatobacter sp.]
MLIAIDPTALSVMVRNREAQGEMGVVWAGCILPAGFVLRHFSNKTLAPDRQ